MAYGMNTLEAFGLGSTTTAVSTLFMNVADMLIAGERSQYAQFVKDYMDNGMTKEQAMSAAGFDVCAKQPILEGAKGGAMAAVMSLPGTAGAIRSGETLGGRAAVADEQGAFRTVRDMEAKGIQEQIRIDSAVNAYMELIGLPKKMLSEAQLDALKTAYRVYEAKSTPENATKFMQQVRKSIQTASNGMKSGVAVDPAVAETFARLEWVKGNIDRGLVVGDNGIGQGIDVGTGKLPNVERVTVDTRKVIELCS